MRKIRVSILGGGPAGLATAFGLSSTAALREQYEVTIYQMGWRVGGKCSSGRVMPNYRLAQNGTHYLFGSYDNCFQIARQVYEELAERQNSDFGTYDEAFLPRSFLAIKQLFRGNWHTWGIEMPTNNQKPGEGDSWPTLNEVISGLLNWMVELLTGWRGLRFLQQLEASRDSGAKPSWWNRIVSRVTPDVDQAFHFVGVQSLKLALDLIRFASPNEKWEQGLDDALIWIVERFRRGLRWALGNRVNEDIHLNRLWTLVDLGATNLIGILRDRVFEPGGLARIDSYDYREWLEHHGASEISRWSSLVASWYNAIAAYDEGRIDKPNISATVTLRGILRLCFRYKGAFAYQMAREVGDTLIAPLYEVLRGRGVRFLFFHQVWDVVPSDDGRIIQRVELEQQAQLKNGDPASYEPLIRLEKDDRTFRAWPDEPNWDQLKGASELRTEPPMDAFYRRRTGRTVHLEANRDYDQLVFALPVSVLEWYCPKILRQRPDWYQMYQRIQTVETQTLRISWKPDLSGLGWNYPAPVLSGYAQPLATWEDNTCLLRTELWPENNLPHSVSTLFGTIDAPQFAPGPTDTTYFLQQKQKAAGHARVFLDNLVGSLWPLASDPQNPGAVDKKKLVIMDAPLQDHDSSDIVPTDCHGEIAGSILYSEAQVYGQVVRPNAGPLQRYTHAAKGTLHYRLRPDQSGYQNFLLAGDWTLNGLDLGSVEGAVMSGLQASRAISGSPAKVAGEGHPGDE